jgi:glucose-1-phosphate cytidylyltransferase
MKVVILAGGYGTRLTEETEVRPKPMVEIGERPILWHIMKHYAHYDCREFLVALGYKGEQIKRFFLDYSLMTRNLTVALRDGGVVVGDSTEPDDWIVHLVDTGMQTNTGGRLKRLESLLCRETFLLTYGDGVGDIDIAALLEFHRAHKKIATITAVRPPARFGGLSFRGEVVAEYQEKTQVGEGWINGGFMVLEPDVFGYLEGDQTSLESDCLTRIAQDGQLVAYKHDRFWQCMDTLREVRVLRALWQSGEAPWKVWR